MEPLDVILCGAGRMGRHHLRVVREHGGFRLRAIVDPALAGGTLDSIPVVSRVAEVRSDPAIAIVATPTPTHEQVVLELIDRGVDLLVEKPLATTPAACERIRARAALRSVRVAIGHVERFNPAVRAMMAALPRIGPVHRLTFRRVGGGRGRERGDVLLELAVHDLDLLERVSGRATLRSAALRSLRNDDIIDAAELALVTERGARASITVDSIAPERARTVTIEGERGTIAVDLLSSTVRCADGGHVTDVAVDRVEPLRAQLAAFLELLAGQPSEVSTIDDGARAVELAAAARASGQGRSAVAEGLR